MKAQADFTNGVLGKIPQRATVLSEVQKYGDSATARVYGIQVNGDHVYYYKRLANETIPKLYVRKGVGGTERLMVDPEALQGKSDKHFAIDWFSPSLDNKYLAYGLSEGGSEQSVLHVKELATEKETGDLIDRANYGPPGWTGDNRLLYNRLQKLAPDAPADATSTSTAACTSTSSARIPRKTSRSSGAGVTPGLTMQPVEFPLAGTTPGSRHAIGIVINGVQREIRVYTATLDSLGAGKPEWNKVVDTSDT